MGRIKDKKQKDKVSGKPQITPVPKICFGFKYLTTNSHYNFDIFAKDKSKKCLAYEELISKMQFLSQINVAESAMLGKELGSESFPVSQFSKSIQEICKGVDIISGDSKLVVFRFCHKDYRLICKNDIMHANLMHVIAFDFDYSAYDHG